MTKTVKGIIIARLIVVLAIILVPISIFLVYNLMPFTLWYSNDLVLTFWIIRVMIPLVFSVSWLYFMILLVNRLADTIETFDERLSVIPSRLKFFYGVNGTYILFIFVFPIITPLIGVISFASFAWHLTTYKRENWEEKPKSSFLTKLLMILFAIIPVFCTVSIIHDFLDLPIFLWDEIWLPALPYLFSISYSLFTALAIGSLIILFSNSGISEYEQIYTDKSQKRSYLGVRILEILLFGFFLFLDLNKYGIIQVFYIAGFAIILFISFVNFIRGKSKYTNFKGHLIGYLLAAVFIGSSVLFTPNEISAIFSTASLIVTAILYIFVFFYTFFTIE